MLEHRIVDTADEKLIDKAFLIINAIKPNNVSRFVVYLEINMLNCKRNLIELLVLQELYTLESPTANTTAKLCHISPAPSPMSAS